MAYDIAVSGMGQKYQDNLLITDASTAVSISSCPGIGVKLLGLTYAKTGSVTGTTTITVKKNDTAISSWAMTSASEEVKLVSLGGQYLTLDNTDRLVATSDGVGTGTVNVGIRVMGDYQDAIS